MFCYVLEIVNYISNESRDEMEEKPAVAGSDCFKQITGRSSSYYTTEAFGIIPIKLQSEWEGRNLTLKSVKNMIKKHLVKISRKKL